MSLAVVTLLVLSVMPHCCLAAVSSTWQSMSPFQVTHFDSGFAASWAIRGANWRHHVRHKFVADAPLDEAGLPVVVSHSFSTCSDSATPPKRNGLSTAAYQLPPGISLPVIATAEFSFIISEACLEAQRPHCASLELWLLEGLAPSPTASSANESVIANQQPYSKSTFLSDSAVWPGTVDSSGTTTPGQKGPNGTVIKSAISFAITKPPFKLQFRDRRGACLEVVNASLSLTSCYAGSAKELAPSNGSDDYVMLPTATSLASTTLPPIGMTTPSQQELFSALDCKCPAGYRRTSYDKCEACPPDTFSDMPHSNLFCTACPTRSSAPFAGSAICVCEDGSFRAHGEGSSQPCTMPPSGPRQLIATYFDVHTVTINWTEPEDFGGRTDLTYQVQCVAGCEDVTITRKDAIGLTRVADVKSRESLETSFVTIRVYALNGVSAVAGPSYAKYFEAVITLRSSDADAAYAHIPDRVFILVGIFGGAGLVAAFFIVYALLRHFRERRRGQPIIVIASTTSEDALDPNKTKLNSLASDDHQCQGDSQEQPLIKDEKSDSCYREDDSRQDLLLIQSTISDDAKTPLVDISSTNDSPLHRVIVVENECNKKSSEQSEQLSPMSTNEAQMSTSTSILSS